MKLRSKQDRQMTSIAVTGLSVRFYEFVKDPPEPHIILQSVHSLQSVEVICIY